MKKITVFLSIIGGLIFLSPSESSAQFIVRVRPVAPAVVVARPVAPRRDYIWVEGEWRWNRRAHNYVWVQGYWLRPRPGRVWVPGHWVDVEGGSEWIGGHWARR